MSTPGPIPIKWSIPISAGAGLLFCLASLLGPVLQKEPFYGSFYLFAWWPYILIAESFLAWRGKSLLFSKPLEYIKLFPLSVCIWLIFEMFNFRLHNWHYINVPASTGLRWAGYFISYATVLPGLMVTKKILSEMGLGKWSPQRPLTLVQTNLHWITLSGVVFLVLPLIWPRYFFPLVWGGFVLLLEPLLYRKGQSTFLADSERGHWGEICLWLWAGLVCGLLWETWNFWAGSKWYYTIPFVGKYKIFEMPVLGFLGFPPFALECLVLTRVFFYLRSRVDNMTVNKRKGVQVVLIAVIIGYMFAVFAGIDHYTVVSFQKHFV